MLILVVDLREGVVGCPQELDGGEHSQNDELTHSLRSVGRPGSAELRAVHSQCVPQGDGAMEQ